MLTLAMLTLAVLTLAVLTLAVLTLANANFSCVNQQQKSLTFFSPLNNYCCLVHSLTLSP